MLITEKSKNISFIFDLDGTLLDIKGEGKAAYLAAFREYFGINDALDALFKGGIDYSIFISLCKKQSILHTSRDYKRFQRHYCKKFMKQSNPNNWMVYAEVYNMLDLLKNSGFSILCATGNFEVTALYKLKAKKLENYFDQIFPNKFETTRTEVFARAKKFANVQGNFEIFIGDSEQDVQAAKNLNSTVILVNHTEDFLEKMQPKPDMTFADMKQLYLHFKEKINGGLYEQLVKPSA